MRIDVENLRKRYGEAFVLDVPALHIEAGETFGLVGNNGAGKTTFLRLLLDLLRPDAGRVLLDGEAVAGDDAWKGQVGAYLDESFLLDFLTADEYLSFAGRSYGMTTPEREAALAPFRAFFTDRVLGTRTKYLRDLSMGNKKKVGLVGALFVRPRLLVLDEPFANLDPGSQLRLSGMLRAVGTTTDTTIVISSHDLGHVTDICERIAVLEQGRIVRDLRTSEITLPDLKEYFQALGMEE